ncbi:MAG: hypothetical protein M0025_12900 [Elusimicrobia bacterium]|nr:hypothetical protein [Elusimicrobiota bacterium]
MNRLATFALLLALPAAAAAQGLGLADGSEKGAGQGRFRLSAVTGYSEAEGLDHRSAGLSAGVPLGKGTSIDASFAAHRIRRDGWLPGHLYAAGAGFSARRGKYMFMAGLKSASDRPFYSIHETDVSLNASKVISRKGPHSFSFGLAYSSRRSFARHIPFPYFLYAYDSEKLSFHLPFLVSWRPSADYELSAAWFPPKYCRLSVRRKVSDALSFKAEYALGALQFDIAGRPDKEYSVFIEQSSAGLWTYYKASPDYTFSLWTGWELPGKYYTGRTYDDHHAQNGIHPSPAFSLGVARLF